LILIWVTLFIFLQDLRGDRPVEFIYIERIKGYYCLVNFAISGHPKRSKDVAAKVGNGVRIQLQCEGF
jgi:hypothetical protein